MTKVTAFRAMPRKSIENRRSIPRQFNSLHLTLAKNSPKDL